MIKNLEIIAILLIMRCPLSAVFAQTDSLSYYLETASRNNPAVMASFHDYKASLQKIPQAGALDDPVLDTGLFIQPMENLWGKQVAQFQLMQMFPWFGTKKAARTEAQHMAKMKFEQFREARDSLFLKVYTQWYVLCRLEQKLRNNQENLQLLKQLEALAVRRYSSENNVSGGTSFTPGPSENTTGDRPAPGGMSGMSTGSGMTAPLPDGNVPPMNNPENMAMSSSGGMSEVLLVQLEIAEIENGTESILSEIVAEKVRFNALLNRPATEEVAVPGEFIQTSYVFDIETVMQMMTQQNPMLGMYREESLANKAKSEMVRKMGYPMFGIGVQYMLIDKTSGSGGGMNSMTPMSSMNGNDMFMPMVSLTLPLSRKKYQAAEREVQFQQQAIRANYTDTLNNLQADLYRYKHLLDDAGRKVLLYRKQTELARTTYDLLLRRFISGKSDLSSVIQVQRQLLDYRFRESEAVAGYNTMAATIQKMISSTNIEN
ncbi:MAG: TolC family protein [Planctomycetaceae bacterium]|jgi:outer membrane protein TolC|nr:TolC family protein [Planctomycetaceae bacterium]